MDPKDYLEYMRGRYKVLAYFKYSLLNSRKEQFEDLKNQLLEEIAENEKMYFDFSKAGTILAPIQKEYENLVNYSQKTMEFFVMYKTLNNL